MDISALVEGMNAGILDFVFDDLKEVQTELVNRRMSSRYMGIISGLMREMIEKGEIESSETDDDAEEAPKTITPTPIAQVKKVAPKPITPIIQTAGQDVPAVAPAIPLPTNFPKAPSLNRKSNEEEANTYPTFSFLAAFFKVWAWISVALVLAAYSVVSYFFLGGNILYISCSGVIALFIAIILLIINYAFSEHFKWKIDIANKCGCDCNCDC